MATAAPINDLVPDCWSSELTAVTVKMETLSTLLSETARSSTESGLTHGMPADDSRELGPLAAESSHLDPYDASGPHDSSDKSGAKALSEEDVDPTRSPPAAATGVRGGADKQHSPPKRRTPGSLSVSSSVL